MIPQEPAGSLRIAQHRIGSGFCDSQPPRERTLPREALGPECPDRLK